MEKIEVTARFDRDGKITPLSFTWRGQKYPVDSTGRSWVDETGQHFLVMVPGERVYELVFLPAEIHWYLKHLSPEHGFA